MHSGWSLNTHCKRAHEETVKDLHLAERASFLSLQTSLLASCLFWEEMSKLLRNCQTLHTTVHSVHLGSSSFWYSFIWEMCILARKKHLNNKSPHTLAVEIQCIIPGSRD